ncbi:glycosyl hydrolase family 88 [Fonsecaea pedrosoi]|nr:glycosyl hydrolase family 88 [Fonsecaea pedrosoi]
MKYYVASLAVAVMAVIIWTPLSPPDAGFEPQPVLAKAYALTSRSWEFGTLTEALLEFYDGYLTVFGSHPFPQGQIPRIPDPSKVEGLAFARGVIWTNGSDLLVDGEGSAADSASLGTAALLLSHHNRTYLDAAKRQANYLMTKATRFNGHLMSSPISHREEPPELWGDFVYMVPPFLAYYGVAFQDMEILKTSVQQCQLYNVVLRTSISLQDGQNCHGLWRHIVSEPSQLEPGICCTDPNVWLTSNAWAVAGMARVLATILRWQPPSNSAIERLQYLEFRVRSTKALTGIIDDMLKCTMAQSRDEKSGLLKNYLDGPSHRPSLWAYGDAAGTALMASAVYRLAVLLPEVYGRPRFLDWAELNRHAVAQHINQDGSVDPVADVDHVPSTSPVNQTSEGQSMAILMYSAWRDCMAAGVCGRKVRIWDTIPWRQNVWW